jgi:hypothetical protein
MPLRQSIDRSGIADKQPHYPYRSLYLDSLLAMDKGELK